MKAEELLKELGLNLKGSYAKNKSYVADIDNSDEYGKVYSILDNNEDLEFMYESSSITPDYASAIFKYYDEFMLTLVADLEGDVYRLTIDEV